MIVGINGYAGSGKDTVGIIIQYLNCISTTNTSIEDVVNDYEEHLWWLEEDSEWQIRKFAGKLKDIAAHLLGIEPELLEDQEYKKTNLGPEWNNMTVREFLQKLGTDALRNGLHPNTWVNALMADYTPMWITDEGVEELPNWIITDVRFPNEAQAIKDKGGIIIRVNRPGVEAINNHPSEVSLDNWKFDYKIANVSDIFDLKTTVKDILIHANIL